MIAGEVPGIGGSLKSGKAQGEVSFSANTQSVSCERMEVGKKELNDANSVWLTKYVSRPSGVLSSVHGMFSGVRHSGLVLLLA